MNQSALKDIKTFSSSLCDDTIEGYNQILRNCKYNIANGKSKYIFDNLSKILLKEENLDDIYIQINTTFIPFRKVENIRQFRALYIDIDDEGGSEGILFYKIWELSERGIIPEPTLYIASGRGIHLYWVIENAPKQAMNTWQQLEDYLYNKLKFLGADKKATDSIRIMRIPGTNNSKNNNICRILRNSNKKYSMYDLREKFLEPFETKINHNYKKNNKIIKNKFFNSYSLHMERINDLFILLKERNYDVKGFRNSFIHLYAYWIGIYTRDLNQLESKVIEFNNSFKEPLKLNEIKSIIKSVDRAIDKFLKYQSMIYSGNFEEVKKAFNFKGGYWYTNKRLIELLEISEHEERKLITIISKGEKYRRKNNKRNTKNEEGLTLKQQELKKLFISIKHLKSLGLSVREIGKELNISHTKVIRIYKKFK